MATIKQFFRTLDAINYLMSSECILKCDPNCNSVNLVINNDDVGSSTNDMDFDNLFSDNKFTMISFIGKKNSKLFWKQPIQKHIQLLEIENDDNSIVALFCQENIMHGMDGIKNGSLKIPKGQKSVDLIKAETIQTSTNLNFLILAAKKNCLELVTIFLSYDFDIDHEDHQNKNVIDYAWDVFFKNLFEKNLQEMETSSKIMLKLLEENSKFPKEFKHELIFEMASDEVKQFCADSEKLRVEIHEQVRLIEKIKKIKEKTKLNYFYNKENKSLLAFVLEFGNSNLVTSLMSLDLNIGDHEDHDKLIENFEKKSKLRETNMANAKECPEIHILRILSKCKIGNNDIGHETRWKSVREAFECLDKEEPRKKILKIASVCPFLKIFFDFKHKSTYYLDPASSKNTLGLIYESGKIFIGAENLLDYNLKFEVYGVIIHELVHLATLLTYVNNFNPYPKMNEEAFNEYPIIFEECEQNIDRSLYPLINKVFVGYDENERHSELIVIPLQVEMHFYNDEKIYDEYKDKFNNLFVHFDQKVMLEFNEMLPVYEKLYDDSKSLTFKDLTKPMQAGILNKVIKFQGFKTTLFKMIENCTIILEKLTKNQIKNIIYSLSCGIEIAKGCCIDETSEIIDRKFIKNEIELCNCRYCLNDNFINCSCTNCAPDSECELQEIISEIELKTSDEIIAETKNSKIFLLVEEPGSGKSATFKHLAHKLKEANSECWVLLFEVHKHRSTIEKYVNDAEDKTQLLLNFFTDVLNLNSKKLEKAILSEQFSTEKVIIMIDGVDEVSSDLEHKNLIQIMKDIRNNFKNQLWISTRPHCAAELEGEFKTSSYKLFTYNWNEKELHIGQFLSRNEYYKNFDNNHHVKWVEDIYNPQMIEVIVELLSLDKISINSNVDNLYNTFDYIFKKLRETFYAKVDFNRKDPIFSNIDTFYQIVALKSFYKRINQNCEIEKFNTKRKEDKFSENTTFENLQCSGYLMKNKDKLVQFIHKTIEEFFVASYILDIITDEQIKKEEIEKAFKLLNAIAKFSERFEYLYGILLSGIEVIKNEFSDDFKNICVENVCKIKNDTKVMPNIELWSVIFESNHDIRRELWNNDENENLLPAILTEN